MRSNLEEISEELKRQKIPHAFFVFDPKSGSYKRFSYLTTDEASQVIERLIKDHGGEAVDQAIDKIIQQGEDEWPETVIG